MKRKFIYHGGPTNSGKTYHALQRLAAADPEKGGGVYSGPLRLLALEVYEQLNKQGVHTSLITGQEKREVPLASHVSSTLEMVNLEREYEVAVIDEIQMIGHEQRGYAWTRAIQGIQAKEIHLCGGLEAYEVVKNIVESMGDDFELKSYNRLSSLKIADVSLEGDYSKIQPGDCVVAFSRADIFSIKREIERLTPYKCCMVYGQLPPETRSAQARLFNESNTGYDVLVASDAIGMGLNLNIRRIVIHTTVKKGGKDGSYLDPSSVKQIAGRAGRLSSEYKYGEVTAWQNADLAYIKAVMQLDVPQINKVGLFPSIEQVSEFSDRLDELTAQEAEPSESTIYENVDRGDPSSTSDVRLSALINKYVDVAMMDGRYFMCEYESLVMVSNWLHSIPLSLPDRFIFSNAPISTRDGNCMNMLYSFAATYAQNKPVALNVRLPKNTPRDVFELMDLCAKHSVLDLYLWLSLRFPSYFVERELCVQQRAHALSLIEKALHSSNLRDDFCHGEDYKKVREKFKSKYPDLLPPEEWGPVREHTRLQLMKVDNKKLYVYRQNSLDSDSGLHVNSSRRGINQVFRRHKRIGDSGQRDNSCTMNRNMNLSSKIGCASKVENISMRS